MKHFAVLIALLRDRKIFLTEIRKDYKLESKIISLIISSSLFFAIYGAIIGSSNSWQQMIVSAIKLPALYLITLLICLPTLYFFDILFGSKLNFRQYAALSLASTSVISVLLFSFAPITLFFLISIHEYNFFLLLNVVILALTGIVGMGMFFKSMSNLMKSDETSSEYRFALLKSWLVLYGLVGSQLAWTLRPFFGAPNQPFQLFRDIEGNFYQQVIRIFFQFLSGG
jgi:hypothetical protein